MWDGTIGIVVVVGLLTIAHTITVAGGIEKRRKETKKNVCYIKTKKRRSGQVSPCVPIGSFFVSLHTMRILQLTGFFSVRHLHGDMWEIFFLRLMCRSFLFAYNIECMSWSCEIINTESCFFFVALFYFSVIGGNLLAFFSTRWSVLGGWRGWEMMLWDYVVEFFFVDL